MNILSISSDRNIFVEGAGVRARQVAYGAQVEHLYTIVFAPRGVGREDNLSPHVTAIPTQSWNRALYILDALWIGYGLRGKQISLITAQDPFEAGLVGWLLSRMLSVPLELQVHTDVFSPYFKKDSWLQVFRVRVARFLLPRAAGVRAVSQRVANSLVHHCHLRRPPVVIPIYTDTTPRMQSTFLSETYPQYTQFLLVTSRLEPEKRVDMAIRAFARIASQFPNAALVIVGGGSQGPLLRRLARTLGVAERVMFEGWQTDTRPYVASAHVFLAPSAFEGYGNALVDAAAAERVIVTTDVGIVGEILTPACAFISPPDDEQAFADNLVRALVGGREVDELGMHARQAVLATAAPDFETYVQHIVDAWRACAAR